MEFARVHSKFRRTVLLVMLMCECGVLCSETLDRCASSPCQNGATCVDGEDSYQCLCPRETMWYMGKDCEELYDACAFADCPNCTSTPGTRDFSCGCPAGFGGTNCTVRTGGCESAPCRGARTECVDGEDGYTCRCPGGHGGEDCRTGVGACLEEPCLNNGSCVALPDGGGHRCQCGPGFGGPRCEEDVDECQSHPCQNGAICMDRANGYQCFCVPGFQGYHCEIDINECASRPCENNGTCVNEKDRYSCECLLGYTGVNCEVEIDECESDPCRNGATCHDHVGLYVCQCPPGFEGLDCEIDIDECESAPCLNEGTCNDLVDSYECDCSDTGFTGEACEVDIPECASNPCQNNATCQEGIKSYSCLCWPGYEGDHCEIDIDECAVEPCQNGGHCFERSNMTNYGKLPQLDWQFSYADAAGHLCECLPGFTGENCSVNIDECESSPCQNGASCEDLVNSYKCICPAGYTGTDCETDIDECESGPCQNGAECEDGVAHYTCRCPAPAEPGEEPWGGRDCDVRLVGCAGHRCQNGATCAPLLRDGEHGHACLCPPGFRGDLCDAPTTFSFSAPGFATVETAHPNRSWGEADPQGPGVKLRFRTTLPDGVLFYWGGGGGDDGGGGSDGLLLELAGGRLRAEAVWQGTELAVALPGAVSDGGWREVAVALGETLVLEARGAGCEGGDCRAEAAAPPGHARFRPPDFFKRATVGGVPPEHWNGDGSGAGFVGCMQDLLIDGWPVLPQAFSLNQSLELGCNKTEWCHLDPCSGHGDCVDLWTRFRCDCHRPFHGPSCAEEFSMWTFAHEDTESFARYEVAGGHDSHNFSVSFFLRSLKQEGLLFQLRRGGRARFTAFLRAGVVAASGLYGHNASSQISVATGNKTLLTVEFRRGLASVRHAEHHVSLAAVGVVTVRAGDALYVGGLPGGSGAEQWGGCFKGCLQDLRLDDARLALNEQDAAEEPAAELSYFPNRTEHVQKGCLSDNTCQAEPCRNGGECSVVWNDFACRCPLNFTGRTCETRVWCVSDPCVMGGRCVDLPDGYECLTNGTFEDNDLQFRANGSLVGPVTNVSLWLRTREENGVLLRARSGAELFCVGLLNSSVLVKISSGNSLELLAFASDQLVADGDWHRVEVSMADPRQAASRWTVAVDGRDGGGSLGAAGNLDFLNESWVRLAENFTGCLGEVRVGGVYLPFVPDGGSPPPQQARFLREGGEDVRLGCAGPPVCASGPCLNGGACEDLFHLFGCSCAAGWEGPRCERDADDCAAGPCVRGACVDRLADFGCDCPPGYGGKRCQEDLDECRGHGCRNGGTCVDGVARYTCVCPHNFTGPLCEWSFPPLQCGQDPPCENGGVCSDGIWGTNCTCVAGYSGDRCEVEVDECESNPCQNGGSCLNRLNRFQCVCAAGFVGPQCENVKQPQKFQVSLLVVAVPLACCCLLLAAIGLVFMVMTARKKRQSEGTYSPSQQEVAGARLEMDSVLKVPPEERLI
ncbi:protein crumbs homolog 2-like [Anguilla anguilla]|uniref:protein crumbs homolog 2-like n=1 Tax=Anguilla anguilla TaxID=7936 RepID=UPI0015AF4F1D|nr:protein crumbs homolog 2-like [Anguilla anguilla]